MMIPAPPRPDPQPVEIVGPVNTNSATSDLVLYAPYAAATVALIVPLVVLWITLSSTRAADQERSRLERTDANRREQREVCRRLLETAQVFDTHCRQLSDADTLGKHNVERVNDTVTDLNRRGAEVEALVVVAKAVAGANPPILSAVSSLGQAMDRVDGLLPPAMRTLNTNGPGSNLTRAAFKEVRDATEEFTASIEGLEKSVELNLRPTIVDEAARSGSSWSYPAP